MKYEVKAALLSKVPKQYETRYGWVTLSPNKFKIAGFNIESLRVISRDKDVDIYEVDGNGRPTTKKIDLDEILDRARGLK